MLNASFGQARRAEAQFPWLPNEMTASPAPVDAAASRGVTVPHPRARLAMGAEKLPMPQLCAGIALILFGFLTGTVVTVIGARADGELNLDVDLAAHRSGIVNLFSSLVDIGLGPAVAPLALLIGCAVLWRRHRLTSVVVLLFTIGGWLSVAVGKFTYHRARPPVDVVHAIARETGMDSFPSGHVAFISAAVASVALVVAWHGVRTRLIWVIGCLIIAGVGHLRLYAGAHYLGDVVAAPMFAVGAVWVAGALGQWLGLRSAVGQD